MAGRRKHHKIDDFTPEVRADVRKRLADGETYESITRRLYDQGLMVGRSSVARYGREWLADIEAASVTKDFVRTLIAETGMDPLEMEKGGTKLAMHRLIEGLMKAESLGKADGLQICKAIGQVVKSSAAVEAVSIGVREEQRKRAQEAAKDIGSKAKKAGIPDDIIREIEERILGIAG